MTIFCVRATVGVTVPQIATTAMITMTFAAPRDSDAATWRQEAYDRALQMLDPA